MLSSSTSSGVGGASGSTADGVLIVGKDDSLSLWPSPGPPVDTGPPPPPPAAQGSHASLTSSGYNSLNKKAKGDLYLILIYE